VRRYTFEYSAELSRRGIVYRPVADLWLAASSVQHGGGVLDASPRPGYVNKPVAISGVMYGSWRRIKGVVAGAPIEITTRLLVSTFEGELDSFVGKCNSLSTEK